MFKFCLIMDYSNSVLLLSCVVFSDSLDNYYPKLSWRNLDRSGYRGKTVLTRILYLKMVLPYI